ncbi:MAG: hypothetical protein V5A76_06585 [Candidatus Thermoplasmatota archaeon]
MNKITEQTTLTDIADHIVPKNTVSVNSRADVKSIVEGLVAKGLVELDGENVKPKRL